LRRIGVRGAGPERRDGELQEKEKAEAKAEAAGHHAIHAMPEKRSKRHC
jgi:hypothetical protein